MSKQPSKLQVTLLADAVEHGGQGRALTKPTVDAMVRKGRARFIIASFDGCHFEITAEGRALPAVIAELERREEERRPQREATAARIAEEEEAERERYRAWLAARPPPSPPPPPVMQTPGASVVASLAEHFFEELGVAAPEIDAEALAEGQRFVLAIYDLAARAWVPSILERNGHTDLATQFRALEPVTTVEEADRTAWWAGRLDVPYDRGEGFDSHESRGAVGALKRLEHSASTKLGPLAQPHDLRLTIAALARVAKKAGAAHEARWAAMRASLT